MSDPLNLSTPLAPPATTVSTTSTDLVLAPPAAVPVVEEKQAEGMLPIDPTMQQQLQAKAKAFVDDLMTVDPRSPEFGQKVASITTMGQREIAESSNVSNRMLERPAAALNGTQGKGPGAQAKVAGSLAELRNTITELDPGHSDLQGARKIFKFIPGGNKLQGVLRPVPVRAVPARRHHQGAGLRARTSCARTTPPSRASAATCGR